MGIAKHMLAESRETKTDLKFYLLNKRNSPVTDSSHIPAQLELSSSLASNLSIAFRHLKLLSLSKGVIARMLQNQNRQKHFSIKLIENKDFFIVGSKYHIKKKESWDYCGETFSG